jgi:hypothetical protein
MNDNTIDKEENHPVQESEQERIAASNDRATATSAEIIKQGLQRAPDADVLKGRKIDRINRTAKTPAAASVTGTSVAAATTNGTTTPSSSTTTTTDNKNDDTTIKTDDDNDKKSATTAGPSIAATREDDEDDEDDEDVDHEEHDINSNSDSDSDDEQSLSEDGKRKARLRLISCLQGYNTFTLQTRKEIDVLIWMFEELVEFDDNDYLTEQEAIIELILLIHRNELISLIYRYGELTEQERNTTDQLVGKFLEKIEDDIIGQFCKYDADDNRALDSDRDTEAQVEAILRFFPQVLTRSHMGLYPIQLLAFARNDDRDWQCNVSRVSFIPLVARLAIDLGLFEEDKRGGLLCKGEQNKNVLQQLMISDKIGNANPNPPYHESIDTKYLQVLIQLKELDLLKKEDIQRYHLLNELCRKHTIGYFPEKRFRFLVKWDPAAILWARRQGRLPLHDILSHHSTIHSTIRGFKHVFEAGIRYYPRKKGINLLFRKDKFGETPTPFQRACESFGHEKVMKVVKDTLAHYNTPPLNIEEAVLSAAIDENVHLDCVYFLIRREPDILQKLLSSSSSSSSIASATHINQKKRKRNDKKKDDDDDGN